MSTIADPHRQFNAGDLALVNQTCVLIAGLERRNEKPGCVVILDELVLVLAIQEHGIYDDVCVLAHNGYGLILNVLLHRVCEAP